MRANRKKTYTVALLVVIAALLGVIIGVLPEEEAGVPAAGVPEVEQTEGDGETASESLDYDNTVSEDTKETIEEQIVSKPENKPIEKQIFIVIDDVGNNLSSLQNQLKVSVPVTFALMPGRPYSEESARLIKEAGFDMILHQPMEAVGGENPGTGAIYSRMNAAEIRKVLDANLKGLPEIKGINNHMGSKVTADKKTMNDIMSYLSEREMFFLDSVTTHESVAKETAEQTGVDFAMRNVLFLDNEDDPASIKKAFMSGVVVAEATGKAIMIGHVKSLSLVDVIEEAVPGLKKAGYTFHGLSSLFEKGGTG